jgi:hypothetical protein
LTTFTASNLVKAIALLPRKVEYEYASIRTKGKIILVSAALPEGPITFKRYNPTKGETAKGAEIETISSSMIWRVANAVSAGQPVNVDRILGESYNTRSVLEALMAHTPQFSMCFPGRVQQAGTEISIEKGHKHIWWQPNNPHKSGFINWVKTEKVISEVPTNDAVYEAITISNPEQEVPSGIERRHAQIQIALIQIGHALKFQTSVAIEDVHILYEGKRLSQLDGVVTDLNEMKQVSNHPEAVKKIKHVDVVWFKNGRLMPAAIEIEQSTGIKSGLDRLVGLKHKLADIRVRYVIAADYSERERVVAFANEERFRELDVRFFSYNAIEEMYSLCRRRNLKGVTEEFLDSFMEPVLAQ